MSTPPKVLVLNVGGTIGMVQTEAGYAPLPGFLEDYLASMPELARPEMPAWEVVTLEPLLDSADMRPADWVRVAAAVEARYHDYDGFVVVHGTDTMAYTASALSFLLPGLSKPVILTGSQLPLSHVRTDGREHIITSILLAGSCPVPEVAVYFGDQLLRGNRSQKIHGERFFAFASGNLPPLAVVGADIQVNRHLVRAPGPGVPPVHLEREPQVAALRLYPGLSGALLERLLAPPTEAVVLETYGTGNFPSRDRDLLQAVTAATERGVVVVNCSQAHSGSVRPGLYSTGAALASAGAVSGGDMTPVAALTKLHVLLGQGESPEAVREKMGQDLAGELTV